MRVGLRCAFLLLASWPPLSPQAASPDYAIAARIEARPYLRMPATPAGDIPKLLSETGAFKDVRRMLPSDALIAYDVIDSFWSDGAQKLRWIAVPKGKIDVSTSGEWVFPAGTVFVKTFELPTDARDPKVKRRLETRLLMVRGGGLVYGVVYKWRADLSDAELIPASRLIESVPVTNAAGEKHFQTWDYPSRKDCNTCHTKLSGGVLGVKARQLNHDFAYPSGVSDNELREWNHLGLFAPSFQDAALENIPRLATPGDTTRSLEDRARSYLDANCSQCHRPGGTVAGFDARYETPLERQSLVNGEVLLDQGIDHPRIISPHDIWRSIAYMRVNTMDDIRMPPIDRETIDEQGVALLRAWINSMPGRPVLDPPLIEPAGGTYEKPVEIRLTEAQPGADIRYTLDGSVPGPSDRRYEKPFMLSGPAVVRTRAFKDGFTRSITSQEVFVVGK
jgi:uncharacterized repeat protein (TIGR03806 family)